MDSTLPSRPYYSFIPFQNDTLDCSSWLHYYKCIEQFHYKQPEQNSPLTPADEKYDDFRETSTAYSSWYAGFRPFRLFEISLSVSKICKIFVFWFFNSAPLYENLFLGKLQCLKYFLCWIRRTVGIFKISLISKDMNESI